MTWEVRAYPARCARAPFALRKGLYFLNWHQSPLGAAFRAVFERLIVRFNLSDVEAVQESQTDRAERLATLVGAGIMSVEEARRELGV